MIDEHWLYAGDWGYLVGWITNPGYLRDKALVTSNTKANQLNYLS